MRKDVVISEVISVVIFLSIFQSCILTKPVMVSKKHAPISVDTMELYQDVLYLTSIQPPRNNRNMKSLNKAHDYIYAKLSKFDCDLKTQPYKANHRVFKNIIASFNPQHQKRIIVGAHYDVCENTPGADDNASGIAAILALANLIDSIKPQLNYRVDIIAYSTEEPPYNGIPMGSLVHAKSMVKDSRSVELMIALDMIGYYSNKKGSQDYPAGFLKMLYPNKANFVLIVSKFGQGKYGKKLKRKLREVCSIDVRSLNAPDKNKGLYSSDHGSYWFYGFNAVLITDTSYYRNDNYHDTSDTIATLNFKYIGEIVKGLYWFLTSY